jgi:release factor glutamine methyltransferase
MPLADSITLLQSAFTRHPLRKLCLIGPTLIETLRKAEVFFTEKGVTSPRLEAQLIFAHFLKLRRIDLFTQTDRPMVSSELEILRQAMRDKIAGKPTAYILGEKEFYGRTFAVDAAVLIPRPETEELVEQVISIRAKALHPKRETEDGHDHQQINHVADFGAGSGAIGVTLAAELKAKTLTLVDISATALAVARANAERLLAESGVQLQCSEADFTRENLLLSEKADIIVSNPPYVLPEEFAGLDSGVRDFEPKLALVAENFESLHRGLIASAFANLAPGGLFALETHPQKTAAVAEWITGQGFVGVEIRNDFAGRPHFVFGRRG